MEEKKLAMEMLGELNATSKRKDIIIALLISVILIMIIAFFIHENITTEEITTEETTYEQNADTEGDNSTINQEIGE